MIVYNFTFLFFFKVYISKIIRTFKKGVVMQLILLLNVSDVRSKRIGPSSDSLSSTRHDAAKLPCSTTTIRINASQSGEFKNLITSGERNLLYTHVEIDHFNLKKGNLSSQSSFDFIIIDEMVSFCFHYLEIMM